MNNGTTYLVARRLIQLAVVVLLTAPAPLQAAKVKVWHHHAAEHFESAELKQTVVSSEGTLRLSRRLKAFADIQATHIWDIVEDKNGNLYVATGDEGKVYKVKPTGEATVVFDSEDSQVFCLAATADGTIYAGTGPSGLVVRITADGNARVIHDSPEHYIWSLAVDPQGKSIYAGTGPKGRIYQLTPAGKASIFYTTKQEHILCLALGSKGSLYAGTDVNGLVYRISPQGKGFIVYQTAQAEVRSLVVTEDAVYAGTGSPRGPRTRKGGGNASSSSKKTAQATPVSRKITAEAKQTTQPVETAEKSESSSSGSDSSSKGEAASAAEPPASGENSVYRIGKDGAVRELFRAKTLMLSLHRQAGHVLVGTGMKGQLFEVDEKTKEQSEIARLDHGQVLCLCRRSDGKIVLGTGDPGKLYLLEKDHVARGTVFSEVLDAEIISKWGAMRWQADLPEGTQVSVAIRTGNVANPDETWSDWSAEQTDPHRARILAPAARYLQYRITLQSDDPAVTPSLHSLALRYRTTNQAPEITKLEAPDLDAEDLEDPKKLKIKWKAVDPNEDALVYRFWIRKEGWQSWVKLEDGLTKSEFTWDTTTIPAGIYHIKLVASDHQDNAPADALTGQRISRPLAVAHVPPTVQVQVADVADGKTTLKARAIDPLVRLTSASYAINGGKWINVFPTDGLFDDKTEGFRFQTDKLKPGTYVLVLKVTDASGNVGTADAVFKVNAGR